MADEAAPGKVELTYGWDESVEVLRKAMVLMALEYAAS